MRVAVMGVLAVVAGCYRPRFEEACQVACNYAGDRTCPSGLVCEADSRCHAPGASCALPPLDSRDPDALPNDGSCTWSEFGPRIPISELAGSDFADPTLRGDAKEMLFVKKTTTYDLYRVTMSGIGMWSNLTAVTELEQANTDETDPALTADGLDLFYVSRPAAGGAASVMEATRQPGETGFSGAHAVSELANVLVRGLDISADGSTLYLTTTDGPMVYMASRANRSVSFATPVAIGNIGSNMYPSISHDQLELFTEADGVTERTRAKTGAPFDAPDVTIDAGAYDPEISDDGTMLIVATSGGAAMHRRSCQ